MVETEFAQQLQAVHAAWKRCRRHAFQNRITSRARDIVLAEMDVEAEIVLDAIARLAAVATSEEQTHQVAEIDRRYGGALRDEAESRRSNPQWLLKLSRSNAAP